VLILSVILVGALFVVLAAIVVDSPLGRSWARRLEGPGQGDSAELQDLQRKVAVLESEVDELNRSLTGMRDELQFVNKLLEDPRRKHS
jgi:predicted PurR-regulated permease PerM